MQLAISMPLEATANRPTEFPPRKRFDAAVAKAEILGALDLDDGFRCRFALAEDEVVDPVVQRPADDQEARAAAVEEDGSKALAMQRHIVPLQDQGAIDEVEPGLQADAAAFGRQGIDRRLNILARMDHEGAASLALGRRPAVARRPSGGNGGQLEVLVADAARRRLAELFDRCIGGAGGKHPVVADMEAAAGRRDREAHLDAVFELERPGGGGHQAIRIERVSGCLLVPALQAGVSVGDVGRRGAEGSPGSRHSAVERNDALGLIDIDDAGHLAGLAVELAVVVGQRHPVADIEAQHLVAADAVDLDLALSARHRDGADARDDRAIVA